MRKSFTSRASLPVQVLTRLSRFLGQKESALTRRTHTGRLLLMFAAGVIGCDGAGPSGWGPSAPSAQTPRSTGSSLETYNVANVGFMHALMDSTSAAANCQEREWAPSPRSRTRIIEGTVVNGDIKARTLAAAIAVLPHRPERIVVVDTKDLPLNNDPPLRGLDAFVLCGSSVIYLRRQSATLLAAEYSGGPFVLMLAAIIWHEIAHTEGLDERQAQQREEDLWVEFTQRGLVDSIVGLTYLAELQRRRQRGPSRAKPIDLSKPSRDLVPTGAVLGHHPPLMNAGGGCRAVASQSDAKAGLSAS